MANLKTALAAGGASMSDLVSCTILFVDGVDLRAAYGVAASSFDADSEPPLVTGAMVAGLGVPGALSRSPPSPPCSTEPAILGRGSA